MNRDKAQQLLPLIQALAEGRQIQFRVSSRNMDWQDVNDPSFGEGMDYRIKPEPRPWKPDECPLYFMVRHKQTARLLVATKQYGYDHVRVWNDLQGSAYGMHELFDLFLHVHGDGKETVCGVLEAQP